MIELREAIEKLEGSPIRLNLGCGQEHFDGWINCDLYDDALGADVKLDASEIPLPDNSVQEISASHLIEHFDYIKGQEVIKEWYRVLKPGGKIAIETPDMLGLCTKFASGDEQLRLNLYGLFFGMPWAAVWNTHKFLYTETQLRWTLDKTGFVDMRRVRADSVYARYGDKQDDPVYLKLEAVKQPMISILIPTLNHLDDLLKPCIDSIKKYTELGNKEIIVVANGCSDGTQAYVESLGEPFRLLWFADPLGSPRAYNEGIKAAKGRYIVFLNNDVAFTEQEKDKWINLLITPLKKDDKVGITSTMKFTFDCRGTPREAVPIWCAMTKRSVLNKIGMLDEIFSPFGCEDIDLSIRAANAGFKLVQVPTDATHTFKEEKPVMDFPVYHGGSKTLDGFMDFDYEKKSILESRNLNIIYDRYESFLNKIQWRHPLVNGWGASQKPKELYMVSEFLKGYKIKKILEIGVWNGGSTIFWANMIGDDGKIFAVDIENHPKYYSGTAYQKQIIEMLGDSHNPEFKKWVCEQVGEVDMLFIDGDHTKEGVKDDYDSFHHLVRPGGIIGFHDIIDSEYHRSKGCFVALFWEEIKKNYHYSEFIDNRTFSEIDTPIDSMGIGILLNSSPIVKE